MTAKSPKIDTYPDLKLYIDGEWLGRGNRRTHTVLNPATGKAIAELPLVDASDLDRALAAAETGFRRWRRVQTAQPLIASVIVAFA